MNAVANLMAMSSVLEPAIHRWTRAEYDGLVEAGAFDHSRVELLDGQIIDMAPTSNVHVRCVARLTKLLVLALQHGEFVVTIQSPFALNDFSQPEPDVVVLRSRPDLWLDGHAGTDDVALAIEVSLSSWAYDSGPKLTAYARAGLREVWLVDLRENMVHVCREPVDGIYTNRHTARAGDVLDVAGTRVMVAVADFLG